MPELHVEPGAQLSVRISASLALALTLPLMELGPRFPGIDPWLAQLPSRLGRAVRTDIRLLCVPLSGALYYLLAAPDDEETIQPALDMLAASPPDEVLGFVLDALASETGQGDPAALRQWLEQEPERVVTLIQSLPVPSPDESFALDAERAVALLRRPSELKAMVELRLRQLWFDHVGPRWREAMPTCRSLAQAAERLFHLGDPQRVMQAIVGAKGRQPLEKLGDKRLVFVPIPFLGPYVAQAIVPDWSTAFIGFGLIQGATASPEETQRDLLAALKALADEARLNAIAYVRRRGEARAADFMREFGWSQPATSRHLRALESIGILRSEWVEGVKRYTIDPERARALARALEQFLSNE